MKRFRVLNVILIALIALAAWRTVDVWRRTPPQIPDRPEPPRPAADPLAAPPRRPALPQLVAAITEKDLFDASRSAPSAADSAPTPEQTPAPPPTLKLAGVIFIGPQREAVFIDVNQNNKQIRMREGEEISGYKVAKIDEAQVSLVSGTGDEVKLDLLIDTARAGGRAAGPGGLVTPAARARQQAGQAAGANAPGGFGPPGSAAAMQRNDARERAQRARERLKRLREEAAANAAR
ncbi:MAG TPA: hypothetical protein VIS07_05855 [Candidatus Binatia bacterium]